MKKTLLFAAGLTLLFAACKKEKQDDHDHEHENEEVTTVRLTFTNAANTADVVVANWKDLDGEGGTAPVISNISLKANTVYNLTTQLLNEQHNPAEDVTGEVEAEGHDHRVFQLFYQTANAAVQDSLSTVATVLPTDKDKNNLPIGLKATITTKTAFTGFLRLVVRHQPGSKNGTYAPGSTDANAEFPLEIK